MGELENKKYFDGYLNSDDAFEFVGKNEYVNCENLRYGTTDTGVIGVLESVGSAVAVTNTIGSLSGVNKCIGAGVVEARGGLIYFVYNSTGRHTVWCYDPNADIKSRVVLFSERIVGGLGFDIHHRIDRNCKVIGDLLYWTDNLNGPRKVNIEAGLLTNDFTYVTTVADYALYTSGGTSTMLGSIISLIKRPPIYPLNTAKAASGFVGNFISDQAYQFTYRYRYRDNEVSALAAYSQLMPMNYVGETTINSITVAMTTLEKIDDDVYGVDFCVKYGNTGTTFIVKSFDKGSASGRVAITDHNAGSPALGFVFYDDTTGIALDSISSITSFDDVPLITQTLEVARNRLFLGNNKLGYSTPVVSSLGLSVGSYDTGGASSPTCTWKYTTLNYIDRATHLVTGSITYYYAYFAAGAIKTWFFVSQQHNASFSASLNSSAADTHQNTEDQLAAWIQRNYAAPAGNDWNQGGPFVHNTSGHTMTLVFTVDLNGLQFVKSGSTYKGSIAFYDQYRRKCGYVDIPDAEVTTPLRTAAQTVFSGNIGWTLNNTAALLANTVLPLEPEIPDWAYYYQIHISKNRTTRNFLQFNAANTAYAVKNLTSGLYTYINSSTAYEVDLYYGCAFNLTPLTSFGMGYTFTQGDLLRAYKGGGGSVLLPVLGTDGNYVITAAADLGTHLGDGLPYLVEIYSPHKPAANEGLFETGPVYDIIAPTTNTRTYSTVSGTINGDCYAIERNSGTVASPVYYFVEAMSPNDKKWADWQTDTGFVNIIDTIGQKLKTSNVMFSDTFVNGTKVNGLNKFQPLNYEDLGSDAGALQKLQLTSKRQEDGTVMLAICKKKPMSIYLGESQLVGTTGNAFVAKSDGVIGTINTLKGDYGTSNPESVVELHGNVYWFSIDQKCFAQYSVNGIDNISNYKLRRFSNLLSRDFIAVGQAQMESNGSQPYIIGGIDPYHKEILWTIPRFFTEPPKGNLPDYISPAFPYPYDFYDGAAKTIVYKIEAARWQGAHIFQTAMFGNIGSELFSTLAGLVYQHNGTSNRTIFYGIDAPGKLCFAENTEASTVKVFTGIFIESNMPPDTTHFRSEYPYVQSSDLVSTDYTTLEGIHYSPILRDRLTPGGVGEYEEIQLVGDKMRNVVMLCMLKFEVGATPVRIKFVNMKYGPS